MISLVLVFSIFLPSYPFIGYAEPNPIQETTTGPSRDEIYPRPDNEIPPEIDLEDFTESNPDEQTDSGSFELVIDESVPDKYRDKLQQEFQRVYPLLVKQWNQNAPKKVHLKNGSLEQNVYGRAEKNVVTLDLRKPDNTKLLDEGNYWVFIHELTHVTTWHLAGAPWLLEGIADYSVLLFGNQNFSPRQFQPPSPNDTVETLKEQKYEVAARFLLWLKDNLRSNIIDELNKAGFEITEKVLKEFNGVITRENQPQYIQRYEQELEVKLRELTGKTLQELWADYIQNPGNYEQSNPVSNSDRNNENGVNQQTENQQIHNQQIHRQPISNQQINHQQVNQNEVEGVNQNNNNNTNSLDVTKIPSSVILKSIEGQ